MLDARCWNVRSCLGSLKISETFSDKSPVSRLIKVYFVGGLILFFCACGGDKAVDTSNPFLIVQEGEFEVEAVITGSDMLLVGALGSGTLSFRFSGDITGTFSVSGALESSQTDNEGCGSLIIKTEDDITGRLNEGFSVLGFRPTDSNKADVFLLGTRRDAPLSAIEAGVDYGIGPLGAFVALYIVGVDIEEFWAAGETGTDLTEVSERVFQLALGVISITSRDSTRITGAFSGTTDANQTSKPAISGSF